MPPVRKASHGPIGWTRALVCLALTLGVKPILAQTGSGDPTPAPVPAVYQPIAADYGPEYLSDTANSRVQSWSAYWGWVNTYYQGTMLASGWVQETNATLARVADPARRAELLQEMNAAGRLVSREWAKDSSIRKINTADLLAWGKRLNTVRQQDTGRDAALLATARQIHAEAKMKIAARTAPK